MVGRIGGKRLEMDGLSSFTKHLLKNLIGNEFNYEWQKMSDFKGSENDSHDVSYFLAPLLDTNQIDYQTIHKIKRWRQTMINKNNFN